MNEILSNNFSVSVNKKEILSNDFSISINKEGINPPILHEIISNSFNVNINKEVIEPPKPEPKELLTLYNESFTEKYGALDFVSDAMVEEERNGLFELSFTILITDPLFSQIEKGKIVVANANDTLLNQKFRIYTTRKMMNNRLIVYARHISYDLDGDLLVSLDIKKQSCQYVLNEIFRNSNRSKNYKGYSDIINSQDYSAYMKSPLKAIVGSEGSVIDTFGNGAELLRDNENIHVLNKRGTDNLVTIDYGSNLTDLSIEDDCSALTTSILPYATYNPKDFAVDDNKKGDISNLRFYKNKSDYNSKSDGEMFIGAVDNKGNVVSKGQSVTIKVYGKEYQFKTRSLNPCNDRFKVPVKETLLIVSQTSTMFVYAVWINTKSSTKWSAIRIDEGNTDATIPWSWTWRDNHFILGEFSMSKLEFVNAGHINKLPENSYSYKEDEKVEYEDITVIGDYVNSKYGTGVLPHYNIAHIDFSDSFDGVIPTKEKLKVLAEQYFNETKCDLPSTNYKIGFMPLSKCVGEGDINDKISLCDIVTVNDKRYNLHIRAKVIKTTYNVLKNRYESIELNAAKKSLHNTFDDLSNKVDSNYKDLSDKINGAINTPDTLPSLPSIELNAGYASIRLSWTYENKKYYSYELYASREENFVPSDYDLVFKGLGSAFLHEVAPGQTWYYKVRAVNDRGNATEFSAEASATTFKMDDASVFFEDAAIGHAIIGSLNADKIVAGRVTGHYIDARNLSVTDGNGKRTFQVDTQGNVSINGIIQSDDIIMANGGLYTNQAVRGRNENGTVFVGSYGNTVLRSDVGEVYLQTDKEVKVTGATDPNTFKDLRAKTIAAELDLFSRGSVFAGNNGAFVARWGYGVVRVEAQNQPLYLQADNEVKCTKPSNPNTFTNLRAYDIIANNKLYQGGNPVALYNNNVSDVVLNSNVKECEDGTLITSFYQHGLFKKDTTVENSLDIGTQISLLVKTMQEQNLVIDNLKKEIEQLKASK